MPRVPKSTLADAQRLFDPERLLPLFESLKERADILGLGSDFLVRLRKSARCESLEARPRSAADRAASVLGDTIVRIGRRDNLAA